MTPETIESEVAQALATAVQLQGEADMATAALRILLTQAARALVKPGRIIENGTREFPRLHVASGNSRKARRFEVMSEPLVMEVRPHSVSLTKVRVEAYPINEAGKRLSGRAGNSSCAHGDMVTLHYDLCGAVAFDDERPDIDILAETIRRAAQA